MDLSITNHAEPPLGPGGRHFPTRRSKGTSGIVSVNHLIRSEAKRLAQYKDVEPDQLISLAYHNKAKRARSASHSGGEGLSNFSNSQRRPELERQLKEQFYFIDNLGPFSRKHPRGRRYRHTQNLRSNEESEGQDLARSDVPLPSDSNHLTRRPTLEREDAFRDASTSKGKVRTCSRLLTDDAEVAELYRMGILYDDKKDAAVESFNLDNIHHEAPVFSIRPAKRRRGGKRAARGEDADLPLHLNISFTDLGNDSSIAPYMLSRSASDASGDEDIQHSPRRSLQSQLPVRVVYELAGSLPSFEIDTSQPPDLTFDTMSDYDCCSETDDVPSQREVSHDGTEPWVMLGDDS